MSRRFTEDVLEAEDGAAGYTVKYIIMTGAQFDYRGPYMTAICKTNDMTYKVEAYYDGNGLMSEEIVSETGMTADTLYATQLTKPCAYLKVSYKNTGAGVGEFSLSFNGTTDKDSTRSALQTQTTQPAW